MTNSLLIYSDLRLDQFQDWIHNLTFTVVQSSKTVTEMEGSGSVRFEEYVDGATEHPGRDESALGFPIIVDFGYPDPFTKRIIVELARIRPIWLDLDAGELATGAEFVFQSLNDPHWNWLA